MNRTIGAVRRERSARSVPRPAVDRPHAAGDGGWVSAHGLPGRSPVRVGGRLAELTVGSFAAAAVLTAAIAARDLREQVVVDVSMLDCLVGTLADRCCSTRR